MKKYFINLFLISLFPSFMHAQLPCNGPGGVEDELTNRFWFNANDLINQSNNTTVSTWANKGGNSTNATSNGTDQPTYRVSSKFNDQSYIEFDGNDGFSISNNSDLNIVGPWDERSFVTTILTSNDITSRQVIYEEGGNVRGLIIYIFEGKLYMSIHNQVNSEGYFDPKWVSTDIAVDTEYILTLNYLSNGVLEGFINGSRFGSVSGLLDLHAHSGNINIGRSGSTIDYHDGESGQENNFKGSMAEFIMYNHSLNEAQRIIIENNQSSKYGIAINNDFYSNDAVYSHEVFGVGRISGDRNRCASQGELAIENPRSLGNNDFVLVGNNNGLISPNFSNKPSSLDHSLKKIWYWNETGNVGCADISFDISDMDIADVSDLSIIIDSDTDFRTGSQLVTGGTRSGNIVTFSCVSMDNGDYFTLGSRDRASLLPVELAFFNVELKDDNAFLSWSTNSEINNDKFLIEKSFDAINFETIGEVKGHGNSNEIHNYQFTDFQLSANKLVYYRLKQVDFDLAFEYSDTKSIIIKKETNSYNSFSVNVFPNPTTEMIQISISDYTSKSVQIYSMDGKTLFNQKLESSNFTLPIKSIVQVNGQYLISINNEDGQRESHLVIVH